MLHRMHTHHAGGMRLHAALPPLPASWSRVFPGRVDGARPMLVPQSRSSSFGQTHLCHFKPSKVVFGALGETLPSTTTNGVSPPLSALITFPARPALTTCEERCWSCVSRTRQKAHPKTTTKRRGPASRRERLFMRWRCAMRLRPTQQNSNPDVAGRQRLAGANQ